MTRILSLPNWPSPCFYHSLPCSFLRWCYISLCTSSFFKRSNVENGHQNRQKTNKKVLRNLPLKSSLLYSFFVIPFLVVASKSKNIIPKVLSNKMSWTAQETKMKNEKENDRKGQDQTSSKKSFDEWKSVLIWISN